MADVEKGQDISSEEVMDYIDDLGDDVSGAAANVDDEEAINGVSGSADKSGEVLPDDGDLVVHADYDDLDYDLRDTLDAKANGKTTVAPVVDDSNHNVWVSNISGSTKAVDLKQLFSKYSKVIAAKIVVNAKGGTDGNKRFGLIQVQSSGDVDRCVKNLHKTEFHGNHILVDKAQKEPQTKKISDSPVKKNSATMSKGGKDSKSTDKSVSDKGKTGVIRTRRSSTDVSKNRINPSSGGSRSKDTKSKASPRRGDLRKSLDEARKRVPQSGGSRNHRSRSPVRGSDRYNSSKDRLPPRTNAFLHNQEQQRSRRNEMPPSRDKPSLLRMEDRDQRPVSSGRRRSLSPRDHHRSNDYRPTVVNYFGSDKQRDSRRRSAERTSAKDGGSLLHTDMRDRQSGATGKDDLRHFLSARNAEQSVEAEKRKLEKEKQELELWKRKELQKAKDEFQNMQMLLRKEKADMVREKERLKREQERAIAVEKKRLEMEKEELRRAKEKLERERREAEERERRQKERERIEAEAKERSRREDRRRKEEEERRRKFEEEERRRKEEQERVAAAAAAAARRRKPTSPPYQRPSSKPHTSSSSTNRDRNYRDRSRERDRDRSRRDQPRRSDEFRSLDSNSRPMRANSPQYNSRYPMSSQDMPRRDYGGHSAQSYHEAPQPTTLGSHGAQWAMHPPATGMFPTMNFGGGGTSRRTPPMQPAVMPVAPPNSGSRGSAPMFLGGGGSTANYPQMTRPADVVGSRGYPHSQTRRF